MNQDILVENVDVSLLVSQGEAIQRCIEDTKEEEEKELLEGVWNMLMTMLDGVEE